MSPKLFQIAETDTFTKELESLGLKDRFEKARGSIYTILKSNPYYGNNIKKLKGEYAGLYRYRLGNYRFIYEIDEKASIVFMLHAVHRRDAY